MAARVKYLSQEWRDDLEKRLKSELPPEKMNFLTSSMLNMYRNCPDGKDRFLYFKYEKGGLAELSVGLAGEVKELPVAEFVITGDYEVFSKMSRAEMGSQRALMSGKLKLKGNMVKALKLAAVSDRVNKVLSQVPAEY